MFYDMTWLEKIIFLKQVIGGYSWQSDYETTPYLYRAMPNLSHYYNREIMEEVVGGSVGWNQLCNGSSVTVQSGHKYFLKKGSAESVATSAGSAITGLTSGSDIVVDLTLALGSTIADYVYSLEQATAGSGVAWLKEHFPRMCQYNPYDAGSIQSVSGLVSHDTVGKNLLPSDAFAFDGYIEGGSGHVAPADATTWKEKVADYFEIQSGKAYTFSVNVANSDSKWIGIGIYDADKNFIKRVGGSKGSGQDISQTLSASDTANAKYVRISFRTYGIAKDAQLEFGSTATSYEPYRKSSYPLDSTLTLRGIPKLDNGKLYYDGDTYGADGTVNRKYGVVDLGTLNWAYVSGANSRFVASISDIALNPTYDKDVICAKYTTDAIGNVYAHASDKIIATHYSAPQIWIYDSAYTDATTFKNALDGVYLVYELATPTTETAQPFTKTQLCDSGGTEEFVATGVNVWDEEWETGLIQSDGSFLVTPGRKTTTFIPVMPNTTYYMAAPTSAYDGRYALYDANKNCVYANTSGVPSSTKSFTTTADAYYARITFGSGYGTTYKNDISINYPSTDTAYHPYGCLVSVGHKSKYAKK